jgi:hypothetical protein
MTIENYLTTKKIKELKVVKGDNIFIQKAMNQGQNQEEAVKVIETVVSKIENLTVDNLFSVVYCFKKVHTRWNPVKSEYEIDKNFSSKYLGLIEGIYEACLKQNKDLQYTETSIVRALCMYTGEAMKQIFTRGKSKLYSSKCLPYIYEYETLLHLGEECLISMIDEDGKIRRGLSYYIFLDSLNPRLMSMKDKDFVSLKKQLARVAQFLKIPEPREGQTLTDYLKGFQPRYNQWFSEKYSKGTSLDYTF